MTRSRCKSHDDVASCGYLLVKVQSRSELRKNAIENNQVIRGKAFCNAFQQSDLLSTQSGFSRRKPVQHFSSDLKQQLTAHDVTWNKRDRFCKDQYAALEQPEEFPTMSVKAEIVRLPEQEPSLSFEKFNFDKEVVWDK